VSWLISAKKVSIIQQGSYSQGKSGKKLGF